MATVSATRTDVPGFGGSSDEVVLYTWTPITNANADGAPISMPWAARAAFQVFGTFGGATVAIQGSNDGTNWDGAEKINGATALSFTTSGIGGSSVIPRFIRPLLTGGAASSVTVTAFLTADR